MADTRRFRGSNRASAPRRRRTGWEEGPGTNTRQELTAVGNVILGNGQAFAVDGHTIARIRGYAEISYDSLAAIGDGFSGAFGIGIVTQAAFAIGISAVPTPVTEIGWEGWIWHQFFSYHVMSPTPAAVNGLAFQIDSKAMRKVGSDEVVFAIIETDFEDGTATMVVRLASRMLLMLP